jgi:hypothetical protein
VHQADRVTSATSCSPPDTAGSATSDHRHIRPPAGHDHAINCTQIIRFGMASRNHLGAQVADHIGGSARGYQVIFVPSTALASPRYDGQPAVYLYIVGLR